MGHKRGDVDCFGASFALAMALEALGKEVEIVSTEKYPESLEFLFYYYTGEIAEAAHEGFDTFVVLDTSDVSRAVDPDLAHKYLEAAQNSVYIDHHTAGDLEQLATVSWRDESVSSTSELVYEVIRELGVEVDKNIATLLLAGIVADTSSFQNQSTTQHSLEVAAELLKRGARQKAVMAQLFGGSEVDVLKLWGLAMKRLNLNKKYHAASTYLTYDDIASCGISGDAMSGIVNYLNQVKGAKLVVLVTEEEPGLMKVSFRTRDEAMDVARLARQLGGGGHVKASGLTFAGSISENAGQVTVI